ncbi:LOW QUALITY PROTEIN: hypothetical protein PHMEG_00038183, partial [Phytophthora megakarya]
MIPIRTFAPGPVTEDIYLLKLSAKAKNHYPRHKGKIKHAIAQIQRYYFTANYYVVNDESLYGLKVAKARTTKYAKHPNIILHFEDKVEHIQLSYQSLHAVDAEHHRALFHDWASPIWTDLELEGLGASNEEKTCLTREGLSQGEYTVGELTTRLIEKPASVINWSVLETWPTENRDGEIEDRDYVGVIEPPFMKSGARYWDVYFREREAKVTMAVEQLSNTINYSFRMGHHIYQRNKVAVSQLRTRT